MSPAPDPTPEQFSRFVHLGEHLLCEKGGSHKPTLLLPDCWWQVGADVPTWAQRLAEENAPGWQWCPWISPKLLTRA